MPSPARLPALLSRGVYELGVHTTAGERILIAVDHAGRRIAERTVAATADVATEWADLWALLDRTDPPRLRLVPHA